MDCAPRQRSLLQIADALEWITGDPNPRALRRLLHFARTSGSKWIPAQTRSCANVAGGPVGGLDERSLEQLVDRLFREAPSTTQTYASAQGRFCKVTARNLVPVDEHSLCVYVAWLHSQGLTHQTIISYLSAVRYLQIACNLGDPNITAMPRLEYVLKGVKVVRARQLPGVKRTRLPITPAILKQNVVWTEKNIDADSSTQTMALFSGYETAIH